jgi:hypothetical protein
VMTEPNVLRAARSAIIASECLVASTLVTAAAFVGLLGFALHMGKPDCPDDNKLDAHLMDLESERSGKQKLWIIPVDGGLLAENDATSSPVWLIPDGVSYTESESYIEMQQVGQNRQGNSPPTKPSLPRRRNNISTEMEAPRRRLRMRVTTDVLAARKAKRAMMDMLSTIRLATPRTTNEPLNDDDDRSTSTDRYNECPQPDFPDILLDLPTLDEVFGIKLRRASSSKQAHGNNNLLHDGIVQLQNLTSIFPDILHGSTVAEKQAGRHKHAATKSEHQQLPTQGVPTIPTDLTSRSDSTEEEDKRNQSSSRITMRMVDGVWLIPVVTDPVAPEHGSKNKNMSEDDEWSSGTLSELLETNSGTDEDYSDASTLTNSLACEIGST